MTGPNVESRPGLRAVWRRRSKSIALLASALALGASLSACAGGDLPPGQGKAGATEKHSYGLAQAAECKTLRADHPELSGKIIKVATSTGTPGLAIVDSSGKFVGLNPDLVDALGECLGFKNEFTSLSFDGIVPAVSAGRFDMAAASMYDTPERRQKVTYVDYIAVSLYGVVPKGNPKKLKSLSDTCGLKTAAATGQKEFELLNEQSDKCMAAGKAPLEIATFPDTNGVFQSLISGRIDFVLNGATANEAFLQDHADFEQAFEPVAGPAEGFQFPKESTQLIKAVAAAIKAVQDKGIQKQLMSKWGLDKNDSVVPVKIGE